MRINHGFQRRSFPLGTVLTFRASAARGHDDARDRWSLTTPSRTGNPGLVVVALVLERHNTVTLFNRLRGDLAVLLVVAAVATYALIPMAFAVYAAWTILRPVTEAVAK
jgi:hypothetical protein